MVRIAIIDDDIAVAQALRKELVGFDEIESVILLNDAFRFIGDMEKMSIEQHPEVVIMDISMGRSDEGIQATRALRNRFPEIQVVMFTISDDDKNIFESFKAGAMGYLLKNEKPEFILKTILDVKGGGAQMSPAIAKKTISFFSGSKPNDHARKLTGREVEILDMVAKGFTYAKISSALFIAESTVQKHIKNIFAKLEVSNKIEALKKIERL
jgi:DNA-binding NarL/FixJ family response regulator